MINVLALQALEEDEITIPSTGGIGSLLSTTDCHLVPYEIVK